MKYKLKSLIKIITLVLLSITNVRADNEEKEILIFVSFSMNDKAIKSYFSEGQQVGATLILKGLVNNSFMETKEKAEKLNIDFDINPEAFNQYKISHVPTIVVTKGDKVTKKISGHIPLIDALELMEEAN